MNEPTILQELDQFELPAIFFHKMEKNHGYPRPQAELLLREAKRYVYLSSVAPEELSLVPSEEIDDAWHEMILLTRTYHRFCEKFCGGYVHHEPSSTEQMEGEGYAEDVWKHYRKTQDFYQETFGQEPDKTAWTE